MKITLASIDARALDSAAQHLTEKIRHVGTHITGPTPLPRTDGEHRREIVIHGNEMACVQIFGEFHLPMSVRPEIDGII